ncbi:MAG TPA: methyltransferase domain-containing protein [Thermomicrobiales bacterium]|nr:methyltransferase domain-containing protein [Thermomicrobiales bacterium]
MHTSSQPPEAWERGDAYEGYVGRWSRLVAATFVDLLDVPPERRWLDVGCGSGALTSAILHRTHPATVVGIDASSGFIAYARRAIDDPRASFQVGNALDLPPDMGSFDAVVSGLVLNFVPDAGLMLREMARVTVDGGVVSVYVWDYAGEMELMRSFWDAAVRLDSSALELDEGRRFPLCQPEPLRNLFAESGLSDVRVNAIDVPTVFHDFDDFWAPFLGGQGPAPGYVISLDAERRTALRDELKATLPTRPDGSIPLNARAWMARGTS